jgi:hypothetical protein
MFRQRPGDRKRNFDELVAKGGRFADRKGPVHGASVHGPGMPGVTHSAYRQMPPVAYLI